MCIIAVKPQGTNPLPVSTLAVCWENNPHGAGFVIYRPGCERLLIQKGFMTLESLMKALNASSIQKRDTVIYHFRIATSGGITPANCHPFPVSANVNDLKKLTVSCKTAFAHNGILGKGEEDLSDTQLYVLQKLSHYSNLQGSIPKIAGETAGSRTAILSAEGKLWLTGKWLEKDGYYFSNETYAYPDVYCPSTGLYTALKTCEYCQAKLPLPEWNGMLFCEQCGTDYAACQMCGTWQAVSNMEIVTDEYGDEIPVCCFCFQGYGYDLDRLDKRENSRLGAAVNRLPWE